MKYSDMGTDELLELLPNNLHLARNSNASDTDRWRMYNMASKKYPSPGFKSARDLLIYTLDRIDKSMLEWNI